jgi:hypothetical protein
MEGAVDGEQTVGGSQAAQPISEPTDPRVRAMLQDYIDGFENYQR